MPPLLPELGVLTLVLIALRRRKRLSKKALADLAGVSEALVKYYENDAEPAYELLVEWGGFMGYTPDEVASAVFGLSQAFRPAPEAGSPVDPPPGVMRLIRGIAGRAARAAFALVERFLIPAARSWQVRRARREAGKLWRELERTPEQFRRAVIEVSRRFQTWYVAERLADESVEAASDRADRALELAELGYRAAELTSGDEAFLAGVKGYALVAVGNARRVANQLHRAGHDFDRALADWGKASPGIRQVLAAWRVKDREGSLRRDQRRFPEALERLQEARLLAPPQEVARILVNRSVVFGCMGEWSQAVEVLREANALVTRPTDPQRVRILFNLAQTLCHLEAFREAEELLPAVHALAVAGRQELVLVRVAWLRARCDAGFGRRTEARAGFEQVRGYFAAHDMAANCAVVSLERAVLDLEAGRSAEVRLLAEEMQWIFRHEGLEPEALAALVLFRAAVAQEKATSDLARRLIRYLYRAQFDPRLRFEAEETGRLALAGPESGAVD